MPLSDSVEKYIGVLQILLHIDNAALCLGILIDSAVAVSTIGDIFPHDISYYTKTVERRDRYEAVAWCLLAIGIVGIVSQLIMASIRGLYLGKIIENNFLMFTVISTVFNILLGFVITAGGGSSVANAVSVQDDFLDGFYIDLDNIDCTLIDDYPPDYGPTVEILQKVCHNFEKLKNCQIASAALCFLGGGVFAVLTALTVISMVKKKRESSYEIINN